MSRRGGFDESFRIGVFETRSPARCDGYLPDMPALLRPPGASNLAQLGRCRGRRGDPVPADAPDFRSRWWRPGRHERRSRPQGPRLSGVRYERHPKSSPTRTHPGKVERSPSATIDRSSNWRSRRRRPSLHQGLGPDQGEHPYSPTASRRSAGFCSWSNRPRTLANP